ncbi:MAG: hypothetical protein AAFZ15_30375 [Bacteroidota bacterium]
MYLKKLNFLSLLVLSFSFVFLASCNKDDEDNTNLDAGIIPGQGIAAIKLGDTGQDVFDAFGSTADSHFSFGNDYFHFLIYFGEGLTFYLEPNDSETLDLTKKVASMDIYAPFSGTTAEGIGIGSTMAEVKAAYGEPDSEDVFLGVAEHTYNEGMVIEYDEQENDIVTKISIN